MTLLFNSLIHSRSEMGNSEFYRKIAAQKLQTIIDSHGYTGPWAMWGFQENSGAGTAVDNEQGDAAADMTLSNAGMWSSDGWYKSYGYPGQRGMYGLGIKNDGGTSGYYGTVADCENIDLNGLTKATFVLVVKANSDGEGNFGRGFQRGDSGYAFFLRNDSGTACEPVLQLVDSGGINQMGTAGTPLVNGYWHVIVYTFDGTQALGSRVKLLIEGKPVAVTNDVMESALVDTSDVLYILDRSANDRAWDGEHGLLAIIPGVAFTESEAQELVELRGLFQPTAGNMPTIPTTGLRRGMMAYDFDGAADPNSDHLTSFQLQPLKTQSGSLLMWLTPDNVTLDAAILSSSVYGATDDEFFPYILNNNLEIFLRLNGAISWRGRSAAAVFDFINKPYFISVTSDGSLTRAYLGGTSITLNNVTGVNSGQWFGDATDSNAISMAVIARAALTAPFNGKQQKLAIYDRPLPQYILQRINASRCDANGPLWLPNW